ncbi:hypothetical protein WMY93_022421 [Mugilogobius chulae]|uniref:SH2 domain-containing protein n=1 Tax=Mugilogobius chulae TaxID=88201 RepID=A0AAW0NJ85_9GOBI
MRLMQGLLEKSRLKQQRRAERGRTHASTFSPKLQEPQGLTAFTGFIWSGGDLTEQTADIKRRRMSSVLVQSSGPVSEVRSKSGSRSWSADSLWPRRKLRRRKQSSPVGGAVATNRNRATSCPGRKCSSGDADQAVSRRSLRQKFQDAVGLCLPLRSSRVPGPDRGSGLPLRSSRVPGPDRGSVLVWSKRRVHVSELLQDCPRNRWSLQHQNQNQDQDQHLHSHNKNLNQVQSQNQDLHNHNQDQNQDQKWDQDQNLNLNQVQSKNQLSGLDLNGNTSLCWDDLCPDPGPGPDSGPDSVLDSSSDPVLVPDLLQISNSPCYWGVLDRFEAEALLEGKPEGTFLLRDSAQSQVLFSVSFRRYSRSLHARIQQSSRGFSFDVADPGMYQSPSVGGLLRHYSDPQTCLFFEPLLAHGLPRRTAFSLRHLARSLSLVLLSVLVLVSFSGSGLGLVLVLVPVLVHVSGPDEREELVSGVLVQILLLVLSQS